MKTSIIDISVFLEENNLVKRRGFPEWYSPDGKTRLVKIGDRYRLDVRHKNWSTFRSDYIIGHREREFKIRPKHQRYPVRSPKMKIKI